jgi:hypothetical protein
LLLADHQVVAERRLPAGAARGAGRVAQLHRRDPERRLVQVCAPQALGLGMDSRNAPSLTAYVAAESARELPAGR